METVILKNGDEVPNVLVATTMLSLRSLLDDNPIAFYELVMSCRDRDHPLWGNTPVVLSACSLIQTSDSTGRATIHDAVRSIVLSAANGGGLDMSLGEPVT